jgi:AcrR family transcriptional regulator
MTSTAGNTGRQRAAAGGGRRSAKDTPSPVSERRAHLVRLAADLFAEKGYQATTVRNIADEAGILSGSLYHHFDSKESIVDEILTSYLDEWAAAAKAALGANRDPRATVSELIHACFATLVPHRAAIVVIQNDWNYLTRFERFAYLVRSEEETERMWVGLIERGQESGAFRGDIDPRLTYRMIRDSVWPTVRWFRPGGAFDERALADHYVRVLFGGICATA